MITSHEWFLISESGCKGFVAGGFSSRKIAISPLQLQDGRLRCALLELQSRKIATPRHCVPPL
jgi:hypothetical protein